MKTPTQRYTLTPTPTHTLTHPHTHILLTHPTHSHTLTPTQLIRELKEEVAKLRVVIRAEGLEAKVGKSFNLPS